MILEIDTSKIDETRVYLRENGKIIQALKQERKPGSQVLLPMIKKILGAVEKGFKALTGIKVNTGPGSFTGLRVGVSVANALGFSLGVSVNSKKVGQLVFPKYE